MQFCLFFESGFPTVFSPALFLLPVFLVFAGREVVFVFAVLYLDWTIGLSGFCSMF